MYREVTNIFKFFILSQFYSDFFRYKIFYEFHVSQIIYILYLFNFVQ